METTNKPLSMTFAGGPTYMIPSLKDSLKDNMFTTGNQSNGQPRVSLFNINSNTKEFREIVDKARGNLRELLSIPNDHQIWFLTGGCHLQFAGIPLNFLGSKPDASANYTVCGHFSKLAFN